MPHIPATRKNPLFREASLQRNTPRATRRLAFLCTLLLFIAALLASCASNPAPEALPAPEAASSREPGAGTNVPTDVSADVPAGVLAIDPDIPIQIKVREPDAKNAYYPVDAALQAWFAGYVAQAEARPFAEWNMDAWPIFIRSGETELEFIIWRDKETDLFDSALYDPGQPEYCFKAPRQAEIPLLFQCVEKEGGEGGVLCELLPAGKTLQLLTWNDGILSRDAELRYTGNIDLWLDGRKALTLARCVNSAYFHLYPLVEVNDLVPEPRMHLVYAQDVRERMLLVVLRQDISSIGEEEGCLLLRMEEGGVRKLGLAPGQEDALACTLGRRGDAFYLDFPYFQKEVSLRPIELSRDGEQSGAAAVYESYKKSGRLDTAFRFGPTIVVRYDDHSYTGYPYRVLLRYAVNGPVHYYQALLDVQYEVTGEGLVARSLPQASGGGL